MGSGVSGKCFNSMQMNYFVSYSMADPGLTLATQEF
jgi:hypothetical protein